MLRIKYNSTTQTLTYYYDNKRGDRNGTTELYDPTVPRFKGYYSKVTKAVIDPSMKDAPLTTMRRLFYGGDDNSFFYFLSEMTTIEGLENLNTINVTDMSDMFRWCTELTSLDLSQFYTGSVTTMNNMFASCGELESLDLLSFDISKVENTRDMFSSCSKLKSIYCNGDWSTSETLTQSENMFYGCTVLVGGQGTTYDATKVDKTYARLDGGASAPGYFSKKKDVYTVYDATTHTLTYYYDENFKQGNQYYELYDPINNPWAQRFEVYHNDVTNAVIDESMANAKFTSLYNMFGSSYFLGSLKTISGLEYLNTENVTDMSNMFFCCGLEIVDITSFNTQNLKKTEQMFNNCWGLTTIYCNEDWSNKLTESELMFTGCANLKGGLETAYDYEHNDASYARPDRGADAPGYFTIKGDANGDGKVTITDAVGIVNKILGNPSTQFHEPAADVNHDYEITITDAVGVVNIILNDIGEALAPAMETPQEQEPVVEPE